MTKVPRPGGAPDDPLLRAVAEHWDEIQRLADDEQRERLLGLLTGTAEPDPAEARAALADELLDLLPPGHPVIAVLRSGVALGTGVMSGTAAGFGPSALTAASFDHHLKSVILPASGPGTVPVTIYLADGQIHAEVEQAVGNLLATAGLRIIDRDDPVAGSWFRRMTAGLQSPAGRDASMAALHAVDQRTLLRQDADVTARLMQNLAPVLGALQPTKDAMIRVGALLIVKVDWTVNIFQLTAAQQARLDHQPNLAMSPQQIVAALNLVPDEQPPGGGHPLEGAGQAKVIDPPATTGP